MEQGSGIIPGFVFFFPEIFLVDEQSRAWLGMVAAPEGVWRV